MVASMSSTRSRGSGVENEVHENAGRMWEITPADWACPVCKRLKPDILRKSKSGAKTGRLVEHHDHLDLFVKETARKLLKEEVTERSNKLGECINNKIAPFIRRFERILICEDCNSADSSAKALSISDRYFSYSPREIALFINPKPNATHEIDIEILRIVEQVANEEFEYLKELGVILIRRAISGRIWGETPLGPARNHYLFMERHRLFDKGSLSFEEIYEAWIEPVDPNLNKFRNFMQKKRRKNSEKLKRKE